MDSSAAGNAANAAPARFPCGQCGAKLEYLPGSTTLRCGYCGFENPIAAAEHAVSERDFNAALDELASGAESEDRLISTCGSCAARVDPPPNATAFACPFCGTDIVATSQSRKQIKPNAVLPFAIDRASAAGKFSSWLRSLWFAPSALTRFATLDQRLNGMYLPHWTFDCHAHTQYTGERGDDYVVHETYTVVVNGRTETRTRAVTRTRWTPVRGSVDNDFDDVLVNASESLPKSLTAALEPWPLKDCVPYSDAYLAGFRSESYQIELRAGFAIAQTLMEPEIRSSICRDIGGDHQRIEAKQSRFFDVRFKHLLLPVWISAYRYRGKTYRFLVNARSGEVRGERPYSVTKIIGAVLAVGALIAAIVYFATR